MNEDKHTIINYKTIFGEDSSYFEWKNSDSYCCDNMKEAFANEFIEFDGDEKPVLTICKVTIYSDDTDFEHMNIEYCPFCGTKIEYKEICQVKIVTKTVTKTVTSQVYEEQDIKPTP